MRQATTQLSVPTRGKGMYDLTREVASWVASQRVRTGLLTVFCRHTSASLLIQENADPDVVSDLKDFFERLVPEDASQYRHTIEGPDDMTSHIRTALTNAQLSVPIHDGELALGTWQGIYLFEHRRVPHRRSIVLHLLAE
ncbi:MAG TPA: secondary thiamine-phosphate synthase enzyme YjbQ [Bryobacteraceae bacterium]|nr:secondary thiamine-phosphate synthase enzyme YjbQ [Bryobacteraceae bacterium]